MGRGKAGVGRLRFRIENRSHTRYYKQEGISQVNQRHTQFSLRLKELRARRQPLSFGKPRSDHITGKLSAETTVACSNKRMPRDLAKPNSCNCLCTCPQLQPENNGFPIPSSTEFQGCASHWQTVTWNYADKDAGKCSFQSSFQGGMLVLITQYNLPLFSTQIHETFITHVHLPTNLMFLPHMRHLPLVLQKQRFKASPGTTFISQGN